MITFISKEKEEDKPELPTILFSEVMNNEYQNGSDLFSPPDKMLEDEEKEEMLDDMATGFADKNQKQEEKEL